MGNSLAAAFAACTGGDSLADLANAARCRGSFESEAIYPEPRRTSTRWEALCGLITVFSGHEMFGRRTAKSHMIDFPHPELT